MKKVLIAVALLYNIPLLAQQQVKIDPRVDHLSKSQLKRHYQIMAEFSEYKDEKLEAYVNRIGNELLAQSPHAGRKYAFIIRENPLPGAFVNGMPVVYIERGLLTALNSEAEFAGVIGHEIGHLTGRHQARTKNRALATNIVSTLASIMSGNSGVGSAIRSQGSVDFLSYRRDHELEADRFGAQYMFKANYDPVGLVSGLSQVFDVSKYAAGFGAAEISHHGLGASHPRTDSRLRKAVENAGKRPPGEGFIGREVYREAVDGIIFGPNYTKTAPDGFKRFSNETLGITFIYPESWTRSVKGSKIVLKDAEKTVQLKITIEKTQDKKKGSAESLKDKHPGVVNTGKIHPQSQRDLGTLGGLPGQRVALVKVARNTFHFHGIAKNNAVTPAQDANFVGIIRSFRRMNAKDKVSDHVTKMFYERLEPGETFASIAANTKGFKDQDIESTLRVINGYYPDGEAEPGTWIKKLRKEKIEQ